MILFILGVIAGVVLDNMFAPKVTFVDGEVKFTWTNKNKK